MDLDQKIEPHPEVVDTEIDETTTALLHLESKVYFSLNATGARIWQDLKQGLTLRDVSRRLQDAYDVDPELAERGVLELVRELAENQLVQVLD
ncbi:MAG: PqqD family protein [bacterium]|nr:PqqD family protein [bacterium]